MSKGEWGNDREKTSGKVLFLCLYLCEWICSHDVLSSELRRWRGGTTETEDEVEERVCEWVCVWLYAAGPKNELQTVFLVMREKHLRLCPPPFYLNFDYFDLLCVKDLSLCGHWDVTGFIKPYVGTSCTKADSSVRIGNFKFRLRFSCWIFQIVHGFFPLQQRLGHNDKWKLSMVPPLVTGNREWWWRMIRKLSKDKGSSVLRLEEFWA